MPCPFGFPLAILCLGSRKSIYLFNKWVLLPIGSCVHNRNEYIHFISIFGRPKHLFSAAKKSFRRLISPDMASDVSKGTLQHSLSTALPETLPAKVLKEITNNFSPANVCGESVFGKVYKGTLPGGALIAVKRLAADSPVHNANTFEHEVQNLKALKHENIVKLYRSCVEKEKSMVENSGRYVLVDVNEICLCYEYLPRGTIDKYIYEETSILDWDTRFKIIKGISEGLHFLHKQLENGPLVHMNLVPGSIWLDDNWVPKIADFGHCRLFGEAQTRKNTMNVKGQIGYMAPEYLYRGEISTMSDIYSLGMVILEITTGTKNVSNIEDRASRMFVNDVRENWNTYDEIIGKYPSLDENGLQQVTACILIGLKCVEIERNRRPTIVQIVDKLNGKPVEMFDMELEE